MNNSNNNFWFMLNFIANICQLVDFQMDVTELSNEELMEHLQKQDKMINEQTNNYLKKIVKQNEIIISLLKKE